MNRFLRVLLIIMPVVLMATGCDFFRKLAGGPTSEEIAAMAEANRLEEQLAAARKDSIAAARKAAADSAALSAALDSLSHLNVIPTTRFKSMDVTGLPRYSIMLGAFSVKENALNLASRIKEAGYDAQTLSLGNSFTGVGICGTDDPVALVESFENVRRQDFCPSNVWILENSQK